MSIVKQKHKGRFAEVRAHLWLLEQGYEVFDNISPCGPADTIAWNHDTGEVLLIDVKATTKNIKQDGSASYSLPKTELADKLRYNVRILLYDHTSGEFLWWLDSFPENSPSPEAPGLRSNP